MTYDPREATESLAQHYHDQRRAAARAVVRHCGSGADGRMTLDMLGLFDRTLLEAEPPRDRWRKLTASLPGLID